MNLLIIVKYAYRDGKGDVKMSWEDVRKDSLPKEELLRFQAEYWKNADIGMIGPIPQFQFEWDIKQSFPEDFEFTEKTKVLDFACGTGRFYNLVKNYNCEYYGLDISFPYLTEFSKILDRGILVYAKGIDKFPFPDNFFDFTYAGSIFTHLSKTQQKFYFEELKRTLKVDGILVVTFFEPEKPYTNHPSNLDPLRNFLNVSEDEMRELSRGMKRIKTGFMLEVLDAKQTVATFKKLEEN
jgi:SAM-dependent methyltransferase